MKSRYVGHGFKQDREKYNHNLDIYAPTAALSSAFLFTKKQKLCVTDVTQAFLRAKTKKTTHLLVDPIVNLILCDLYLEFKDFVLNDGKLLVKLDYALYGIIEAANLWYNDLQKSHVQQGFKVNPYDPCIVTKPEIQKLCYVDDIANRADSKDVLDKHIKDLEKVYGKLTVQYGPTVHFLGANFHLPGDGTVHISIKLYLTKLCEENMDLINIRINKYPAKLTLFDVDSESPLLSKSESERVHSTIAKILYASQKRSDLTVEDRDKLIYLLRATVLWIWSLFLAVTIIWVIFSSLHTLMHHMVLMMMAKVIPVGSLLSVGVQLCLVQPNRNWLLNPVLKVNL